MLRFHFINLFLIITLLLAGCGAAPAAGQQSSGSLSVIATTTIAADVVRQVGGDLLQVDALLPVGADPHSFDPAPQDMAKIANADLIFASGAGLEEFLAPLIENASAQGLVIDLSQGIQLLEGDGEEHGYDPHVWMDPNNVLVWVENIRAALSQADPQHAANYEVNANNYSAELIKLDAWVREQVASIPQANRRIVTDHLVFSYFSERYGLEQVGALVPGYSTLSSPSARELAEIESDILQYGVKAVFVGKSVNPSIAQRIAEDTQVRLVYLYTGSLSAADGPAANYIDYIRYNVSEISAALK